MLTDLCQELRNWFNRNMDKWEGEFRIEDGNIRDFAGKLQPGQYFRVIGSVFNDGVHKNDAEHSDLVDETFTGAVWAMGVPMAVLDLVDDIKAWQTKYGSIDSEAMSPFMSESFGGYSYSKGSSSTGASSGGTWQSTFASQLAPWRKI